jgi:hypothetical protein
MPATFNFPNTLTDVPWFPVKFEPKDKEHSVKGDYVFFKDGCRFILNECLRNYKDVGFNKKTGMFLTSLSNTSNFLENNKEPASQQDLSDIFTPIASVSTQLQSYDKIISIDTNKLLVSTRASYNDVGQPTNFSDKDILHFKFIKDIIHSDIEDINRSDVDENLVMVESPTKLLLTWQTTSQDGVYSLSFLPPIHPESYSQKFAYLLSEDGICLFKPNSRYFYIVQKNFFDNGFSMTIFSPETKSVLPPGAFLKFVSYLNADQDRSVKDSYITKYKVNKLDFQQEVLQDETISEQNYLQNFLGLFPYEHPKYSSNFVSYDLQIHGLKNYQTPEYNYSLNSNYINGYKGIHRVYDRIFAGTNQKGGLPNVCLGYQSSTTEINFLNDSETFFSYPPVSPRMTLKDCGLIEDGAIAGIHPAVSDRIYLKEIDYTSKIPGLPQPPSITKLTNSWFCSWLSGSTHGEKVWMDRFYNAAYYTLDQALSAQTLVYHDKLDPLKDYVYDVPSTMMLEPGAFYRYYHVGSLASKEFLPYLDGTLNSPLGSKVLEITSWNSSPLKDTSGLGNNGLVYKDSFSGFNDTYWELDGSNHATFPSKTTLLEQNQFTTSLWIYSSDWTNIKGRQIFGNFYDSGYGLINESALTAPLFTFIDNSSGQVYNLNYQLKITNISETPLVSKTKKMMVVRLPEFNYWIFDAASGYGYKYDAEGRFLTKSDKVLRVSQIEIDDQLNLYLFQPSKGMITVLNSSGKQTQNNIFLSSTNIQRIEIFKYQTINYGRASRTTPIEILGNASVIDNDGNIWQSIGNNIYKTPYNSELDRHESPVIFATVGLTQQITCDSSNNLWILHDQDKISKLTPYGKFSTVRIGKRINDIEDPCLRTTEHTRYINFLKTPERGSIGCDYYEFKDLAIVIDATDKEAYILDVNGDLLSKIDLSILSELKSSSPNFIAEGDFTGYQFLRKFGSLNKSLSWKLKIANADGSSPEVLTLSQDTSQLKPGWHHFALSFDAQNGIVKSYIDTVDVGSGLITTNKQLYFDFRSSLLLGTDSIKNSSLNDIIQIQNAYKFVGKVAELRIYNKSLNSGEVEQLYFSSNLSDNRKPLTWNMNTGNRSYIEQIKHWFQMQLPGSKSKYFNINIYNLPIQGDVKKIIEEAIRKNVSKITPANAALYKINWF